MLPTTFLNGNRWEDAPASNGTAKPTGSFRKEFPPEEEIDQGTEADRKKHIDKILGKTAGGMKV